MNDEPFTGVKASVSIVAALYLALTMLTASGVEAASTGMPVLASPTLCAPAMRSVDARSQCFSPTQAAIAERQVPVPVVTPRGLVWRMSGLALSEVSIEHGASGVAAINYVFGRIPLDTTAPASAAKPLYGVPRPQYVLVREFIGHTRDAKRAVFRSNTGQGRGAWHFVANFSGRNLALSITTNMSKRTAERIGVALVRRGAGPAGRG